MKLEKIHEDKRGFISIITGDEFKDSEWVILRAKKGMARGGCRWRDHRSSRIGWSWSSARRPSVREGP